MGRKPLLIALALSMLAGVAAAVGWWQARAHERGQGQAIFRGEAALVGTLAGQQMALPTLATRCSNCHEAKQAPLFDDRPLASRAPQTFASPLSQAWLTTARQRHGGPATRYDAQGLCTLLRSGVDPAHIMISTTMPRYEVSEAQCDALWAYLNAR